MADEQVRIDLLANDKASKTIDQVADDVAKLEKADPEIEITADDNASDDIAKVADEAEQLERLSPEVEITADASNALKAIADVDGEADELTAADRQIVLKAKIDDARAELKTLRDDLEQTGREADDTNRKLDDTTRGGGGSNLRGNAIADLTGPLGEASSAASDFAGVFDGLGDISEGVASRVGVSAEQMTGAITGIGVAVAGAAALWTYYRQKQEEARRKQEELVKGQRELNKAIEAGDRAAAAAKFDELYGKAIDEAARFGSSIEDTTRFITGQTNALPSLEAELARVNDEIERNGGVVAAANTELVGYRDDLEDMRGKLVDSRNEWTRANGSIEDQDRRFRQLSSALGIAESDTRRFARASDDAAGSVDGVSTALDRMRGELDVEQAMLDFKRNIIGAMSEVGESAIDQQGDVLALKQSVVDMGEEFKKNPVEIQTVLDAVEAGDLQTVAQTVEDWYKMNPVVIASKLDRPTPINAGAGGQNQQPRAVLQSDVPSIGVVNMMLPAGWRGDPVRAAHAQRRRTGRYYSRS